MRFSNFSCLAFLSYSSRSMPSSTDWPSSLGSHTRYTAESLSDIIRSFFDAWTNADYFSFILMERRPRLSTEYSADSGSPRSSTFPDLSSRE